MQDSPLPQRLSIDLKLYFVPFQTGMGAGFLGTDQEYISKAGFGLIVGPNFAMGNGACHLVAGLMKRKLEYYSWAVVPNPNREYRVDDYEQFMLGLGYHYGFSFIEISRVEFGMHVSRRSDFRNNDDPDYYLSLSISFDYKSILIFSHANASGILNNNWENEMLSLDLGMGYRFPIWIRKTPGN